MNRPKFTRVATLVATLSLWPALGVAQQITPSDGLRLPDASIATAGDATALELNPGGLAFMRGTELGYGFELATEDLRGVAEESQSYFLAGGIGFLGGGISAQWLQKPDLGRDLQSYRKFSVGSGVALAKLGFGANLNFFGSSDDERLDGLVGVDVGMQLRAARYLGFGLMVRDINTPFVGEDSALPARVEGAAALRLWGGRIVLEQMAQTNLRDRYVRLTPRLSLEPVGGMRIFGRSDFSFTRTGDVFGWDWDGVFAGLELSLGAIGAQYAGVTTRFQENASPRFSGVSAYHWISPGKREPLISPTRRWIWIDLNAAISEEPASGLLTTNTRGFLSVVRELERIEESRDVDGVVFGVGDTNLGYAQLWELRRVVRRLNEAGKKTIAVLGNSALREYYFASAASEIWYVPTEVFTPSGLRTRFMSFREAFDKIGVEAQFVRIGDYKSTPEMLLYDEPTPADREQRDRYLDALWQQIVADIASSRGKSTAEIETLLTGTHLPDEAVKAGLVDSVAYPDEVEGILRSRDSGISLEEGYPENIYPDDRWGRGSEIAVVAVDGNIVNGRSSTPIFGAATAGSESLAATFDRLRRDPQVRAVVVRVDSGGGSAAASDLIYRSIRSLAKYKPVVASMGGSAMSGGYYVAAGADEIFATPLTSTGSIGIFAGKVNVARLADRVGVNVASTERGRPSTFTDVFSPWNEEELQDIGKSLNYMYRLFLTQVAHTRPLTAEEIDAVARGRIWVGRDAQKIKLVDSIGGVMDAVRRAEQLAGLEPGEASYRQYTNSSGLGLQLGVSALANKVFGREQGVKQLVDPTSMLGSFIKQTTQAWMLPMLYAPGEALMLPFETIEPD